MGKASLFYEPAPKASTLNHNNDIDSSWSLAAAFAPKVVTDGKFVPSRDTYPPDIGDALWVRGEEFQKIVLRNTRVLRRRMQSRSGAGGTMLCAMSPNACLSGASASRIIMLL
jgi:hypothetical protein